MANYLVYHGSSSGDNQRLVGFSTDYGYMSIDELQKSLIQLFPEQEGTMPDGFELDSIIKTPLGTAKVLTRPAMGAIVVRHLATKTVFSICTSVCEPIRQPAPKKETKADLRRELRKCRAELARQQAALVKRKSVARYQAERIREAKRSLQVAAEDLTGVKPLPNVPLTALARIVAEQGEQQRGLKIGDVVRSIFGSNIHGTVMDMTADYIQIRPAERGTPTFWGPRAAYRRIIHEVS